MALNIKESMHTWLRLLLLLWMWLFLNQTQGTFFGLLNHFQSILSSLHPGIFQDFQDRWGEFRRHIFTGFDLVNRLDFIFLSSPNVVPCRLHSEIRLLVG